MAPPVWTQWSAVFEEAKASENGEILGDVQKMPLPFQTPYETEISALFDIFCSESQKNKKNMDWWYHTPNPEADNQTAKTAVCKIGGRI